MTKVAVLLLAFAAYPLAAQTAPIAGVPPRFEGRALVSVSDADMLSSAYDDGDLGPAVGPDTLSIIRLDRPDGNYRAVEVAASNSVTGPPSSVAVTPDGRFAVVIETRGPRVGTRDETLRDLKPGRAITVVDLRSERPRVIQKLNGFPHPQAVAIDPSGTLVAVAHRAQPGVPPLSLHRLTNGRLSPAATPAIPGWSATGSLIGVAFHPSRPVLALLDVAGPALSFVQFTPASTGELNLSSWGNILAVERDPYIVRFTPDGHHALVNGTYAAHGFNLNANAAPRGSVQSVRIAGGTGPDGAPQHRFVARAETGAVPEGLNISPDGRFVVTANLERSTPRPGSPQMARYGSMSLIRFDPATGALKRVGDFAFDGALPEMAVFDNSSRFIAVTVFNQFDDPRARGSIDFWRVETDPFDADRIELVKTRHSIPVTRGAHSLAIVR